MDAPPKSPETPRRALKRALKPPVDPQVAVQPWHKPETGPYEPEILRKRARSLLGLDQPDGPGPYIDDPRTHAQRAQEIKALLARAFADEALTLQDTAPWRARVCWRITRNLMVACGAIAPGEAILSALDAQDPADDPQDPWSSPMAAPKPGPLVPPQLVRLLRESPIPPVPTPDTAHTYQEAFALMARALSIRAGTPRDPDGGHLGLKGLLPPATPANFLRRYPSLGILANYEDGLIAATLSHIAEGGLATARQFLQNDEGLTHHERQDVLALARTRAVDEMPAEPEEERAMMRLRLESLILRVQATSPELELRALKTLATVVGITRQIADNDGDEFEEAVQATPSTRGPRHNTAQAPGLTPSGLQLPEPGMARSRRPPGAPGT